MDLIEIDKCFIDRGRNQGKTAELCDAVTGGSLWAFPGNWTDHQIESALAFANHAYAIGHQDGWLAKAAEVRGALFAAPALIGVLPEGHKPRFIDSAGQADELKGASE